MSFQALGQRVPVLFPGTSKAMGVRRTVKRTYYRAWGTAAMEVGSGHTVGDGASMQGYNIWILPNELSFIHLLNKYLLGDYHVPNTVLNVETSHEYKRPGPCPHGAESSGGTDSRELSRQMKRLIADCAKCCEGTKEGDEKEMRGDFFRYKDLLGG